MGEPFIRRRVMLVSRNMPPLLGGMERLNWHMAAELVRDHDVRVIGPEGCAVRAPPNVDVVEVPLKPLWKFLLTALRRARREAVRWKPDIVLAGSGLTAPIAWLAARSCGAQAVVYVHGLDIIADHPVYRWLWIPVLRRFDKAIANSANTADLARRAGIAGGRIQVVPPGTNLDPMQGGSQAWPRVPLDQPEDPTLLSVGRLTERKGLAQFIVHALPRIVDAHPRARLVIIGDDAPHALRKGIDPAGDLLTAIASSGMRHHVVRIGPCSDDELTRAYASAAVNVFPVRQIPGDVEGFGMVAIEAAAHGLPTVAFAVGGVPDAVSDGISGYLVRPGDYEAFANRVNRVLTDDPKALKASSRVFAQAFSWEKFGERIRASLVDPLSAGTDVVDRQGHAVLDLGSRAAKAKKIEVLLGLSPGKTIRLLEVGTGSGGIAHYFGTHSRLDVDVEAVDVQDARQIFEGYRFTRVEGTGLPFPDEHFDVVVSNHVIEHVGDVAAQRAHLAELRRVLRPGGIGYLAVPNRWMLVEPHYRLAFLSWWPESWRSGWLRLWGRGRHYDCKPLTAREAEHLLGQAGFAFTQLHSEALRVMFEIERPDSSAWTAIIRGVPQWLFRLARRAFPTLIYLIRLP